MINNWVEALGDNNRPTPTGSRHGDDQVWTMNGLHGRAVRRPARLCRWRALDERDTSPLWRTNCEQTYPGVSQGRRGRQRDDPLLELHLSRPEAGQASGEGWFVTTRTLVGRGRDGWRRCCRASNFKPGYRQTHDRPHPRGCGSRQPGRRVLWKGKPPPGSAHPHCAACGFAAANTHPDRSVSGVRPENPLVGVSRRDGRGHRIQIRRAPSHAGARQSACHSSSRSSSSTKALRMIGGAVDVPTGDG